jgi:hypothetical protein
LYLRTTVANKSILWDARGVTVSYSICVHTRTGEQSQVSKLNTRAGICSHAAIFAMFFWTTNVKNGLIFWGFPVSIIKPVLS